MPRDKVIIRHTCKKCGHGKMFSFIKTGEIKCTKCKHVLIKGKRTIKTKAGVVK